MKIKKSNNIIGFTYFGQPVTVPASWWLAVDGDNTLNAFQEQPVWDIEIQAWLNQNNLKSVLYIGEVEDLPVYPKQSLVRAIPHEHHDPRLYLIRAAVGNPIQESMTDVEYDEELKRVQDGNIWHKFFKDVLPILAAVSTDDWMWIYNPKCLKYLNLRIDLRDCGTLLMDGHSYEDGQNTRILPQLLAYQSSGERLFVGASLRCYFNNNGHNKFNLNLHNMHLDGSQNFKNEEVVIDYLSKVSPINIKVMFSKGSLNKKHYREACDRIKTDLKRAGHTIVESKKVN